MPYKDSVKQKQALRKWHSEHRDYDIQQTKRAKQKYREWFEEVTKGKSCLICHESTPCCIDYHHLDKSKKISEISTLVASLRAKEVVLKELKKCVPLCSNCHRKLHKGLIVLP